MDGADRIAQAWKRERPGTPVSSIGVITRIWRLGRLLGDERRRTHARLGVDASTLDLLSTLRRAGPPYRLTPTAIAAQSMVSAGAVSQRLSRAERAGLVSRLPSGTDGRGVIVELTPAGHDVTERTVDELLRHEETLLSALTPEQRSDLADLLKILLADLTDRLGTDDRPARSP
jgi:DNA-binding MarR family transcriptional regulator